MKNDIINQAIKKAFSFLWIPVCLLIMNLSINSCVKSNDIEREGITSFLLETKVDGGVLCEYEVTNKDIANYIFFKSLDGLSRNEKAIVKEVIPVKWQDVTCLYVVQYEKGYEVISADKRSPLPLMKDDEGVFELPSEDTPIGFHLYTLAEDVWLSLYQNEPFGEPDKETRDNMESSLMFWKLISADYKTVKDNATQTKSSRDTVILDPDHGHWELIGRTTQTEVYDSIGHLTTTWWHQFSPFNYYCPYYSPGDLGGRCPAGCVAIAGAQMLYFMHYKTGTPEESPSTGSCTGYVEPSFMNNPYQQVFGNYSSITWDKMKSKTDPYHYAAMLIGDVGKKIHTSYTDTASCATLENLRDSAFVAYGINCSILNYYSGNFLKGTLDMGYPVVCAGFRQVSRDAGDTTGLFGHTFIVDRYLRSRDKITFFYEWIFDDPGQSPGYPIMTATVVYNSPYITMYQMNWGQGYYNNYDVWCGMNGMWQYGDYLYTHDRQMFYNYRVIDE